MRFFSLLLPSHHRSTQVTSYRFLPLYLALCIQPLLWIPEITSGHQTDTPIVLLDKPSPWPGFCVFLKTTPNLTTISFLLDHYYSNMVMHSKAVLNFADGFPTNFMSSEKDPKGQKKGIRWQKKIPQQAKDLGAYHFNVQSHVLSFCILHTSVG